MRILVFGAGAVGSYLGGMLVANNLVSLVGRHDHMERVDRDGLYISGLKDVSVRPSAHVEVPDERYDVVLVTVKSYDLDKALDVVRPVLGDDTALIVVQNGLEMLAIPERVAHSQVYLGVASFGVTFVSPGEVRYAGDGTLSLGVRGGEGDVHQLVRMFQASGVRSEVCPDIVKEAWRKAVINSAINPITALVRRPNGVLLDSGELLALCECLFEESMGIAVECGELPPGDLTFKDVEWVINATSENRSSMLQDVERGRRTEVDAINGAFLKRGRAFGHPIIYNNAVTALIHGMELRYHA